MDLLDEDLDDSALICKSLIPKRKTFQSISQKNSKQIKLESSSKIVSKNSVGSARELTSCRNPKQGELSNYFVEKLSKCPLCLKSFKSDSAYSSHMKQCAKTHKMTTQQLLEALELQKKQMEERRALGLRSQSFPSPKKHSRKKVENKVESYDLALGLALSKSLATCDSKTVSSQEVTLEEFGFTSRTNRRKDCRNKPVLKERTSEERQRIIVEKVAVVLLDDEQKLQSGSEESKKSNDNTQVPQLWNLGENNRNRDWYVTSLKTLVLSEEETQQKTTPLPADISSQISELNLPQKEYHENWKKMINNSIKSDLMARTKDNQDVYLHSLVFYTRCPEVLENDFESTLEKYNLSTVVIFLEYLYCGTLNSLTSSEIDNLCDLASKINFKDLMLVLDCLKNKLNEVQTTPVLIVNEVEKSTDEKSKFLEDKDLFAEDNSIEEGNSEESNAEKSYWSFIQNEKNIIEIEKQVNSKTTTESEEIKGTGDLEEDAQTNSDCVVLSSGSEPQCNNAAPTSPMEYEVHQFDPYDDFHIFSEEPFSPVGLNSQSLLVGDVSPESLKISTPKNEDGGAEERKNVGYCSTPITVHQPCKIKSSTGGKYKKRKSDLSANRILRKSLGLKNKTPKSSKRSSGKRNRSSHDIVEALANSVLHELSKSPLLQRKNFVEITPLHNREEFGEAVTPSPNFSMMGESVIKAQLARYGLKKNLAKSKAKKILRHIYDELHPLYNTETGKIVKKLPSTSPKGAKTKKTATKNSKTSKKATQKELNFSKESQNMSDETMGPTDESEFEDLNETLTQSVPSNAVDLPSAFSEYLQNNPEYHQKILLYEPIWLEELQKSLKETYKKHFKMSDIMDYLDQKCVTFRSEAQAKKIQKRYQKKEGSKKRSPS